MDHINYLSIGVLLERLKLLRNLNGDLKLAGMSPFLRDIFKVVGMDRFFEDYTSLEDAIESFDDDWEGRRYEPLRCTSTFLSWSGRSLTYSLPQRANDIWMEHWEAVVTPRKF